jgi:hypothetical protein
LIGTKAKIELRGNADRSTMRKLVAVDAKGN